MSRIFQKWDNLKKTAALQNSSLFHNQILIQFQFHKQELTLLKIMHLPVRLAIEVLQYFPIFSQQFFDLKVA